MTQILMLVAIFLAVIAGPLAGGAVAGCKALKRSINERRTAAPRAAAATTAPAAA